MRDSPETGDGAAIAEIEMAYRLDYPRFLRTATAIVGNGPQAADAVHDAFVRAVRHRRAFRGRGSVDAWLWRLVVNAARDVAARERRELAFLDSPRIGADDSIAFAEGFFELVRSLPERQRFVLFLRYYADLDYAMIAEVLGIRPGTVGATLHAAHGSLRAAIEEATL